MVGDGSFVLSAAWSNYCGTGKELLAMVVLIKHVKQYLLGKKFKVRTDHNSLILLMRFKDIEGQLLAYAC